MAPSHQEVLDATVARTEAMQGLVQEICGSIPVADFPQAPVAALFAAGSASPACAGAGRAAASAAAPGQRSQLLVAALVGGVVGAVAAAAVTVLLAKASGKR